MCGLWLDCARLPLAQNSLLGYVRLLWPSAVVDEWRNACPKIGIGLDIAEDSVYCVYSMLVKKAFYERIPGQ